jgi:hypothetical protein
LSPLLIALSAFAGSLGLGIGLVRAKFSRNA